ncbi:MAG: anti-anti-sigma factor [Bacteroidetes bacterium]|nr:anti-anti-sigma factor [Bacteroidota bacterium]
MTITENKHGRVTVISLKGNLLGEPETTELRQTIYRLTKRDEKQVVLDLGGLKAINSTGLGVLISALTSLRRRSGDLSLAKLSDKVHALMMITHLIRVFKVYDTVERAVASLGR